MSQQRPINFFASSPVVKPCRDSFLNIAGVVPYIPECGYVGTPTDRANWLRMSLIYLPRPAIFCRLRHVRLRDDDFYIVLQNFDDLFSVEEYIKFTYSKVVKTSPQIRFVAQLIPLELLENNLL